MMNGSTQADSPCCSLCRDYPIVATGTPGREITKRAEDSLAFPTLTLDRVLEIALNLK
jgi:hypothetical protein